jgi:hypothetical protein
MPEPISNKEIDVVVEFMLESKDFSQPLVTTETRKRVGQTLNLSTAGLSGYVKTLLDKQCLWYDSHTGLTYLAEFLKPDPQCQMFKILLRYEKQNPIGVS